MEMMQNIKEVYTRWREKPEEMLPFSEILRDERLQPRIIRNEIFKNQGPLERTLEKHVDDMVASLASSKKHQLTPILVAQIEGKQYIVDGHHRWKAYRRVKRDIPARVLNTSWRVAVGVSRIVNCQGQTLGLTTEQRSEQCWQFLMELTNNGSTLVAPAYSCRRLAKEFNIRSQDTVAKMKRRILLSVDGSKPLPTADDVTEHDLDLHTGAARWRHVRSEGYQSQWLNADRSVVALHKEQKWCAKLGKLHSEAGDLFQQYVATYTETLSHAEYVSLMDRLIRISPYAPRAPEEIELY